MLKHTEDRLTRVMHNTMSARSDMQYNFACDAPRLLLQVKEEAQMQSKDTYPNSGDHAGTLRMDSIDCIMQLLDWNRSKEDQSKGLDLARGVRSFNVFLQPRDNEFNKNVWDNCAIIISEKSDEELQPYLPELFAWLQDMTWPGASSILKRLKEFNKNTAYQTALSVSISHAKAEGDVLWEDLLRSEL